MAHRFLVGHFQSAKVRRNCINRRCQRHRHQRCLGICSRIKHLACTTPCLGWRLLTNNGDGASRQSLLDSRIRSDILGMIARGCQALDRERLARKVEREAILDTLGISGSGCGCVRHFCCFVVVYYFITMAEIL